jgi:hypothetical protein
MSATLCKQPVRQCAKHRFCGEAHKLRRRNRRSTVRFRTDADLNSAYVASHYKQGAEEGSIPTGFNLGHYYGRESKPFRVIITIAFTY